MIIHILLSILIVFFNILTSWLPAVDTLPFGIDTILATAVSYYHGITETIPYLQVVWNCFIFALGFEMALLLLKFILGHRSPGSHIN